MTMKQAGMVVGMIVKIEQSFVYPDKQAQKVSMPGLDCCRW